MALQGSIDTFALDDVLRLVASTAKTGRLSLVGSRGAGELVVRDGLVLDGAVSTDDARRRPLRARLRAAALRRRRLPVRRRRRRRPRRRRAGRRRGPHRGRLRLLAEWREIERVVPGPWAAVTLAPDAPGGTVKIEPAQWRLIASVGNGAGRRRALRAPRRQPPRHRPPAALAGRGRPRSTSPTPPMPAERRRPRRSPSWSSRSRSSRSPMPVAEETTSVAPFSSEPDIWGDQAESFNGNGANGNGHGSVDHDVLFDSVPETSAVSVVDVADHDEWVEAPMVDAAEFARRLAELPPRGRQGRRRRRPGHQRRGASGRPRRARRHRRRGRPRGAAPAPRPGRRLIDLSHRLTPRGHYGRRP